MKKWNWKTALNGSRATSLLLAFVLILGAGVYTLSAMTSATAGKDSISIAVYAPDAAATSNGTLDINCNDGTTSANYNFYVKNSKNNKTTQVAMKYDVVVALKSALPAGMTVKVDGESGTVSSDGLTYSFSDADWYFDAGVAENHSHVLTFAADTSKVTSNYSFTGITVTVKTSQIGF